MDWRPLESSALRGHQGRQVLITHANGVGYYGKIEYVERDFVLLSNRGMSQRVDYAGLWSFTFVDLPKPQIPKKMGHPRFNWSSK